MRVATPMLDTILRDIPDNISRLAPYQPGKPIEELERELGIRDVVKIASNENPLGPSPLALEAARRVLADVHMYPDGSCFALRRALAERLGTGADELVFGAGSNELIGLFIQGLCRPGADEVLSHRHAFIAYRLCAQAHGVDFVEADCTADLACDIDALIAAITPRTRVVFLANPNNPTGAHVPVRGFERLLAALPARAVLVVDEAYHEYAVRSAAAADYPRALRYRERCPALVVLRTFSKIYGLAGLRIGYAVAPAPLVDIIDRVRLPFNVTSVAQSAALAALEDDAHVERSAEAARHSLALLAQAAPGLGLRVHPSAGNFALVDVGRPAAPVYQQLLAHGVIVRPMGGWGLPHHLRISVGTPAQTERAVRALAAVCGAAR
jgi:histidinol-phosphate aminotransferase